MSFPTAPYLYGVSSLRLDEGMELSPQENKKDVMQSIDNTFFINEIPPIFVLETVG